MLDLDTPDADAPAERLLLSQARVPLWVLAVVAVVVAAVAVEELDVAVQAVGAELTVVNAGALPVEINDVRSATAGVRINPVGPDSGVTVAAGEGRKVYVGMGVVCRTWGRRMPIDLVLSVTTADGRRRVERRPLDPGAWLDTLQNNCPPAF